MVSGSSGLAQDSNGQVFIGKLRMDETGDYSSVMVDELSFWNRQLSETEVEALRNQYEMWPVLSLTNNQTKEMLTDINMQKSRINDNKIFSFSKNRGVKSALWAMKYFTAFHSRFFVRHDWVVHREPIL